MLRTALTLVVALLLSACHATEPLPVTTENREVASSDGVVIRYDVRGSGEPTLLLLSGWTNSREIWGPHPDNLSRFYRVVTIDLAGHGASDANRSDWTMERFGDDVVAVAQQENLDRIVLVGFSMGAGVAVEAAARMPGRVEGIVFVDSFHDPWTPSAREPEQMEAMFRANWGDTSFVRAFAFTPDAPDSLVRQVAARMPERPHDHWFAALHGTFPWMRDQALEAIQNTRVPLAAINTTRQSTNVAAFRQIDPSFTAVTIDGVGHAGILMQRIDDFDAHLKTIITRFAAKSPHGTP